MLSLKGRQDHYRLLFPDNFIPEVLKEKYGKVLRAKKSFIYDPTEFINESIQKIQILGFNNATTQQQQTGRGTIAKEGSRNFENNNFMQTSTEYSYRSEQNPLNIIDKTLNIDFRHTDGFLNYFILFETFFHHYARDTKYDKMPERLAIDIYNDAGEIYSRIVIYDPVIDGMDMLDLDFTQPVAQSQTFRVIIKYSNIDFEFIEED